jgi:hypothetical protein
MSVYDQKKIIAGLAIFLSLATLPLCYNVIGGKAAAIPKPELVTTQKTCILAQADIRKGHMQLLDAWRQDVIRQGIRQKADPAGKPYSMSLAKSCLDCHPNKVEFCDRCHDYVGVSPSCWDCHTYQQKEVK